jgi:hypothetical protein
MIIAILLYQDLRKNKNSDKSPFKRYRTVPLTIKDAALLMIEMSKNIVIEFDKNPETTTGPDMQVILNNLDQLLSAHETVFMAFEQRAKIHNHSFDALKILNYKLDSLKKEDNFKIIKTKKTEEDIKKEKEEIEKVSCII